VKHTRQPYFALWITLIAASYSMTALCSQQPDPWQAAQSLEHEGRVAEAEAAWTALSKAHPSNPEPLAHLGLLEARQEHYVRAVSLYRKALALNPTMPGLRLNLGLALFKNGEYKEAITIFNPLLKTQPLSSPETNLETDRLTVLIGMSHYGLGEYAQAVPYLKEAAGRDQQNLPLRLTLAHSCLLSKQYQCVLDIYHEMIALNADSAEAEMLVGEALDEMKDSSGAILEFRAAVKANPKEPNAHFGLGYLLWTLKQYQEAAQQFQAELDNDPEHIQSMLYLADAQIQMNQMQSAAPLLTKALKSNPASSMGHLDLGIVYSETGHNEDALRELRTAAKLAPEDVTAHFRLGQLYRSMGKTDEAKAEFDKAKSITKATNDALLDVMSEKHAKAKAVASEQ
jgi:tetratricopeptide (TPR) repeat protein